jgi:hypothetical protein
MAEKVVAFGHIAGQPKFQYGPKTFSASWGGAFTALEIAHLMQFIPALAGGHGVAGKAAEVVAEDTPKTRAARGGRVAEKVNLLLWLERLELSLFDLNAVMIHGTIVRPLWVDKILPSQRIDFADTRKRPSQLVADGLVTMDLNKWGIVKEMALALSEFDLKTARGRRSVSFFFTL